MGRRIANPLGTRYRYLNGVSVSVPVRSNHNISFPPVQFENGRTGFGELRVDLRFVTKSMHEVTARTEIAELIVLIRSRESLDPTVDSMDDPFGSRLPFMRKEEIQDDLPFPSENRAESTNALLALSPARDGAIHDSG
jgi:hypothetical protein